MTEPHILIDADACPVKEETYKVALRHKVAVRVVSNSPFRIPDSPLIERVLVSDEFDAADDWIVEHTGPQSVVITGDILLADRCLKAGATVLAHNGKPFTAASIGPAIATRAIMADLRAGADGIGGGPAAFSKADRSRFLQALDQALVKMKRRGWAAGIDGPGEFMRCLAEMGVTSATGHSAPIGTIMAKGQRKSNKEIRKPKAEKGPKTNASQPSLKPGGIKGLENMKNG